MGSWKGRGNQYIQFVRVPYCKVPNNGKQIPAFPLEAMPGTEPRPQRWEIRVLPLCHLDPCKLNLNPISRESCDLLPTLILTEKPLVLINYLCSPKNVSCDALYGALNDNDNENFQHYMHLSY